MFMHLHKKELLGGSDPSFFWRWIFWILGSFGMSSMEQDKLTGILWEGSILWKVLPPPFAPHEDSFLSHCIPNAELIASTPWPELNGKHSWAKWQALLALCFCPDFKYEEMLLKWRNTHFSINFSSLLYPYSNFSYHSFSNNYGVESIKFDIIFENIIGKTYSLVS